MLHKAKKILESITGYWIYKKKHLPIGSDFEVDLQRLNLIDSKVVFDVGANVGQTALHYHEIFSSATIYSFEPVKKSYAELVSNTKNLSRIQTENIGLGEQDEPVEITLNPNPTCTGNSLNPEIMYNAPNGIKETLDIRKVDSFCKNRGIEGIDLLKIDTEGWEIQTLLGATDQIKNKRIKAILCEVGFTKENIRNTPFNNLNAYMAENGYFFFGIYGINHLYLKEGNHFGNALFVSKEYLSRLEYTMNMS